MHRRTYVLGLVLLSCALFSMNPNLVPNWFRREVTKKRSGVNLKTSPEFVADLWTTIVTTSLRYGVDPIFTAAVIGVESNFANVPGAGGVLGMMQIHPKTAEMIARVLGLERPKDWNELLNNYKLNITYGTAYLGYLFKKHGDYVGALREYNNGPKRESYAATVMRLYEKYRSYHFEEFPELVARH